MLTISDYKDLLAIKDYYNEIYHYILSDLVNNYGTYGILSILRKHSKDINFKKCLFSPRLVKHFESVVYNMLLMIDSVEHSDSTTAKPFNIFRSNLYYLFDDAISMTEKAHTMWLNLLGKSTVGTVDYTDSNSIILPIMFQLSIERRSGNIVYYNEIRVLTRFVNKHVVKYCRLVHQHKRDHESKFAYVCSELVYLPCIGQEYITAKDHFNQMC